MTRPQALWLTENIKLMMRLRYKALKKYKSTQKLGHWNYYKQLRNYVNYRVKLEKRKFMEDKLNEIKGSDV